MLVLYHDYTSPASALAVKRLQRLADDGLPVEFIGIDLLGLSVAIPPTLSLLESFRDHEEELRAAGIDAVRPHIQPPTLLAHLVGELAADDDLGDHWREAAYRAYWERSVDLSNRDVLIELAGQVGLDPGNTRAVLDDPLGQQRLRRRMASHRGEGVGGVPVLEAHGTFVSAQLPEEDLRALAEL